MDHLLTIETHIEGDQQEVLHNVERHFARAYLTSYVGIGGGSKLTNVELRKTNTLPYVGKWRKQRVKVCSD